MTENFLSLSTQEIRAHELSWKNSSATEDMSFVLLYHANWTIFNNCEVVWEKVNAMLSGDSKQSFFSWNSQINVKDTDFFCGLQSIFSCVWRIITVVFPPKPIPLPSLPSLRSDYQVLELHLMSPREYNVQDQKRLKNHLIMNWDSLLRYIASFTELTINTSENFVELYFNVKVFRTSNHVSKG